MKWQRILIWLLSGLLVFLIATEVASGPLAPTIDWDVRASGGGHFEQGAYALDNTVGQAVIGPASSGNLNVHSGYWQVFNVAPIANEDNYNTAEDTTLVEPPPGVLENDTDANGDALTAVLDSSTSHGSLTLNADGSFTYVPEPDYCGSDGFTYHANDGAEDSNVVAATIAVSCEDETIYLPRLMKG